MALRAIEISTDLNSSLDDEQRCDHRAPPAAGGKDLRVTVKGCRALCLR